MIKKQNVIAITETKLKQKRMSVNINIYGYNFIHHDSKTCAGGVAFYINKSLKYVQSNKTSLNLENVEDLWIELTINEKPYVPDPSIDCFNQCEYLPRENNSLSNKVDW